MTAGVLKPCTAHIVRFLSCCVLRKPNSKIFLSHLLDCLSQMCCSFFLSRDLNLRRDKRTIFKATFDDKLIVSGQDDGGKTNSKQRLVEKRSKMCRLEQHRNKRICSVDMTLS